MATEAAAALKKERHEKEASRLKKRAADSRPPDSRARASPFISEDEARRSREKNFASPRVEISVSVEISVAR
jgi:hypothetical protein